MTIKSDKENEKKTPKEEILGTKHVVAIDGVEVAYTATTGTILLKEEDEEAKASIFFVAYTRDGVEDVGSRPITFSFNGGPGSSSVWLHLGLLGPLVGRGLHNRDSLLGLCQHVALVWLRGG